MHPVLRGYQRLLVKNFSHKIKMRFLEVFFFLTYAMYRNCIN